MGQKIAPNLFAKNVGKLDTPHRTALYPPTELRPVQPKHTRRGPHGEITTNKGVTIVEVTILKGNAPSYPPGIPLGDPGGLLTRDAGVRGRVGT